MRISKSPSMGDLADFPLAGGRLVRCAIDDDGLPPVRFSSSLRSLYVATLSGWFSRVLAQPLTAPQFSSC